MVRCTKRWIRGPQIARCALDGLCVVLANLMLFGVDRPLVGSPPIRVSAWDATRLQQRLQLEKNGILSVPKDLDVCFLNTPPVARPGVGLKPDRDTGAGLTKWTSRLTRAHGDDQRCATTSADSLCCARHSPWRHALRSGHAVDPVLLNGTALPRPPREAALVLARFSCRHDCVRTKVHYACRRANAAGVHGPRRLGAASSTRPHAASPNKRA